MVDVACSAQLQKLAGHLALMVMRITSSKAGMMNVWTLDIDHEVHEIYHSGRTESLSSRKEDLYARFCKSFKSVTLGFSPSINLPRSHLLLMAKLHTLQSGTAFFCLPRFNSKV